MQEQTALKFNVVSQNYKLGEAKARQWMDTLASDVSFLCAAEYPRRDIPATNKLTRGLQISNRDRRQGREMLHWCIE